MKINVRILVESMNSLEETIKKLDSITSKNPNVIKEVNIEVIDRNIRR